MFAAALVGVALVPRPGEAQLRVVATLPDLYVLTRAVAGDAATVDVVARFGQNPHDMEVRPSHMLLVRRADVLVRKALRRTPGSTSSRVGATSEGSTRLAQRHRGLARRRDPQGTNRARRPLDG